ncbi:hypothetical protein N7493_003779 [Penicillium malachiteum]|uniref:Uncharacterized protein n=1 Tax=Penicillium malachiteum TaxID=1324776 RepID=A0AAD6HQC0_9EURO|nr:hypothetical protein N7493_003779 [Penicillium malachiteum]
MIIIDIDDQYEIAIEGPCTHIQLSPPSTVNAEPATPKLELEAMSDLLSSRWAPSASEASRHNPQQPQFLRRPRSEYRIRSPNPAEPNSTYVNPKPPYINTAPTRSYGSGTILTPSEELARFMKIVARLRWKLPFLAEGYRLATRVVPQFSNDDFKMEVAQAEIMFKIDFHEYYALLERAIVHLLAVFNISVSSVGGRGGVQVNGGGYQQGAGVHRYHANVLQALEEETTPLSPVLGTGPVLELLRKAKELRNRWKTADMTWEERERDPFENGRPVLPLVSYDFDEIFNGIFGGLEAGYLRARIHVELCKKSGDDSDVDSILGTEADWLFMVDGMDWEAV